MSEFVPSSAGAAVSGPRPRKASRSLAVSGIVLPTVRLPPRREGVINRIRFVHSLYREVWPLRRCVPVNCQRLRRPHASLNSLRQPTPSAGEGQQLQHVLRRWRRERQRPLRHSSLQLVKVNHLPLHSGSPSTPRSLTCPY